MRYLELLEQQPTSPAAPAEGAKVEPPKTTEVNPELTDLQTDVVADAKLNKLDGRLNPTTFEILQSNGTNLLRFLKLGERPERIESLVNRLEGIFTRVGEDYCRLDHTEAKHMATGIVCSLIDSLTGQINTGATANPDAKKDANPSEFDAWGKVAGNISKLLGGEGQGGAENLFGDMFSQLIAVFGSWDVLWQRLKSIFLLIELTRKSREILCDRTNGKPDPAKSVCTWNQSIVHDAKLFVGSARIVESAIKADKDIIQPENIHTLADFKKAIKFTEGTSSVEYGLLDLLWLRMQSVPLAHPIAAQEYFADVSPQMLEGGRAEVQQKIATKILDALELADDKGESFQEWWKTNRASLEKSGLRGKVDERMKAFMPLSDPNDPDSLYSSFNKLINLFCGLLTGTAFSEEAYDPNAKDLWSATTDNAVSNTERKAIGDQVLEWVVAWSVSYYAINAILKWESAYKYDAINPSDSADGQLSIGLIQWHGERAGKLVAKMGALDRAKVLDPQQGLGPDLGKFVLDTKPNGRWLETQKRWSMQGWKRVPNEKEEDGTPLAAWKKDRVVSFQRLLNTDLAKHVMNTELKTDVESYVTVIKKELDITESDDKLSVQQKQAIVMLSRFYNAWPEWTKKLIASTNKSLDINVLKDAALANPWNTEANLLTGVKSAIQQTYEYCTSIT